ncbi:hypothetical protein L1887_09338 [Cichorium endivia]|nr:hypothetical protein L1887_09338 [Cichorium endivia]
MKIPTGVCVPLLNQGIEGITERSGNKRLFTNYGIYNLKCDNSYPSKTELGHWDFEEKEEVAKRSWKKTTDNIRSSLIQATEI